MIHCSAQDLAQLGDLVLKQGAELRFRAAGTSMQPVIQDGQTIRVAPAPAGGTRLGDILFYRSGADRAVVHRLLKRVQTAGGVLLLTKGDACASADPLVPPERVLGRVVAIEAMDGRLLRLDRGLNLLRARLYAWLWLASPYLRRALGKRPTFGALLRQLLLPR